jgi:hypothetical protein
VTTRAFLVVAIALAGCDPSLTLLRSDALPFLREPLVEECCACLAEGEVIVGGPDEGCLTDSRVPVSPCLCDIGRAECEEALMEGTPITVVGACVEVVGPCADACEGTLAYPE